MKLIYVSGKYTEDTSSLVQLNIEKAEEAAIQLIGKGWGVFTPHKNSAHYEKYKEEYPNMTWDYFMEFSIEMLKRHDAIFMLNNWKDSEGGVIEHDYALKNNIPIYYEKDGYPSP